MIEIGNNTGFTQIANRTNLEVFELTKCAKIFIDNCIEQNKIGKKLIKNPKRFKINLRTNPDNSVSIIYYANKRGKETLSKIIGQFEFDNYGVVGVAVKENNTQIGTGKASIKSNILLAMK